MMYYGVNTAAMMMAMGPQVFGISLFNLLMIASGIFYLICALAIWKRVREEKNELISALFAFLMYQAVNMFFMGLLFQTNHQVYGYLSALSIFIGTAYMLKFPFHSFAQSTRKALFILSLIVGFGILAWFLAHPALAPALNGFTLWYDIIVNGVVVGGSIILLAFRSSEQWLRIKALGGGGGVLACCIVGNATMLTGALVTSSIFQFLAPVLILGSLAYSRRKEKAMTTQTSA